MGFAERLIPFDFAIPGVKLGLSNAVVLAAMYVLSFWDCLALVLMKCVFGAALSGSMGAFIFSVSGGLLSLCCMYVLYRAAGSVFGPVGISVAGAVSHNTGQIAAAAFVMRTARIAYYLPVLVVSGVAAGVLVGLTVKPMLTAVKYLRDKYT